MKKIINYFKMVKMLNNSNMGVAWFTIVRNIMDFAVEVQQKGKPMLTKIASVDMSETQVNSMRDIVSIWAGVGEANPIERVRHLKAQNTELKRLLKICTGTMGPDQEDLLINIQIILDNFE